MKRKIDAGVENEIWRRVEEGEKYTSIASDYKVNISTVSKIKKRRVGGLDGGGNVESDPITTHASSSSSDSATGLTSTPGAALSTTATQVASLYAHLHGRDDSDSEEDATFTVDPLPQPADPPVAHEPWRLIESNVTLEHTKGLEIFKTHRFHQSVHHGGPSSKVSKCAVHTNCPHLVRMRLQEKSVDRYVIHERFRHVSEISKGPTGTSNGLNPALYTILDPLLHGGAAPTKAHLLLLDRLKESPDTQPLLSALPDDSNELIAKIAHRKRHITDPSSELHTFYAINQFLLDREVSVDKDSTTAKSELAAQTAKYGVDDVLCLARLPLSSGNPILRIYEGNMSAGTDVVEEGTDKELRGYVFASARMLQNVQTALRDTPSGFSLSADGTYKLVNCRWTLIVLSTHTVNLPTTNNSDVTHSAVPLLFALVHSESELAYRSVFGVLRAVVTQLFDATLTILSTSMDCAPAIKNAATSYGGPTMRVVNCWPHFIRNASKKARSLGCSKYFDSVIEQQLNAMHCAPSETALFALAGVAMSEWRRAGHDNYASWFNDNYLSGGWHGWWAGASGVPGAGSTNNPMEAFNGEIKRFITNKVSLAQFMTDSMPSFMRSLVVKRCPEQIVRDIHHAQHGLITTGTLSPALLQAARALTENKQAVVKLDLVDGTVRYLVRSHQYLDLNLSPTDLSALAKSRKNPPSAAVLATNPSFAHMHQQYCCLHSVRRVDAAEEKSYFTCDCKAYYVSGYVCSHVLAVYHHCKLYNVDAAMSTLDGPRPNGRPCKRTKALTIDTTSSATTTKPPPSLTGAGMVGALIRGTGAHDGLLSGHVGPWDKAHNTYTVRFSDAPGGVVTKTLTAEEAVACFRHQKQWEGENKRVMFG